MNDSDFWINNIKVYFDILYKLNINYIKLIGTEKIDIQNEFLYGDIVDNISQIIPMTVNEITKEAYISKKNEDDGIIDLLGKNYEFVKDTLELIIEENKLALFNIKMLRNKLEHNPHRLMGSTGISTNGMFSINFGYLARNKKYPITDYSDIELDNYSCNSKDIQEIIIKLNILFSTIQQELLKELDKYYDSFKNNDYFKECLKINYLDFNDLYESKKFYSICKLINKEIMN